MLVLVVRCIAHSVILVGYNHVVPYLDGRTSNREPQSQVTRGAG
jgi:hypothetical protein